MPRKPRVNIEDGIYHAFARGNNRMALFYDDEDRGGYLRLLERVAGLKDWRCLAFCLMTNHIHLMIETPEANLSSGMQTLQGRYAQGFNFRHGRSGHVFEGRYGAVLIESDVHLRAAAAYIARNPVDAALCERPESWAWSSYRATIGAEVPPWLDTRRLLRFFGSDIEAARRAYAGMVAQAL